MNFTVTAVTDRGTVKAVNQDGLFVRRLNTERGRAVFAVMCDGLGGLEHGELASACLINAFTRWMYARLPLLCTRRIGDADIGREWEAVIAESGGALRDHGREHGERLGTTVLAMLVTQECYYILNVGDTRVYALTDTARQLTRDQTLAARDVELGVMTPEDAERSPRGNVLLQCVGVSERVEPELLFGDTAAGACYLICTDGFRHAVTPEEMLERLGPGNPADAAHMRRAAEQLVETNKARGERDNISVIAIRTG
jgi:serine/threonine protein phosphatase PrpC